MKRNIILLSFFLQASSLIFAASADVSKIIKGRVKDTLVLSSQRRYILTGGPCVGKTSIIEHLKTLGHAVVPEAAKDVIAAHQKAGIAQPWLDPEFDAKISQRIHERQIEAMSNSAAYVFFDRGPVDPLSYATYYNFSVHRKIIERVEEILDNSFYQTTVFLIAPLIEDLYENSTIRYEDRETSEKLGNHLATCYRALGFEVLEVPFGTVEARARWILDYIKDDICQPWWNHGRFEPLYAAYK